MIDVFLRDVFIDGIQICELDYVQVCESARLYYMPSDTIGNGFRFYAVERVGSLINNDTDTEAWNKDSTLVDCIVNGVAYFDGVRHLYYGDEKTDNYGYHYYPNLSMICKTIVELRVLEQTFCKDV